MSINTTKKAMVGAAAAAVVALGTLGGFAAAESTGGSTSSVPLNTAPTTTVATTQTKPDAVHPDRLHPDRAARRDAFQKDLAAALGISVDKLKAAEKKVLTDRLDARLDQAVAAGNITRERADAIEAAVATGDLSKLPPKAQARIQRIENRLGI